ncbi:flotillin family protein [Plastoroseomonas hellenica]|uniref:Flotillin family protein n=1 Tax=Plastoroseomonas hellenica TaxID=2687306 RepID=A0ABS5F1V9_9PROT|nr:flotillin domain-containing protein [Plastoroseomonas hellenica]MBR0641761.1 flotillin family protein [Plastoroseomonas hellenica]MBR0666520.1 flotillin family protein [Plastoroseomonas hellenica]
MDTLITAATLALIAIVALFAIGFVLSRLYRRSSKETAYVKTGLGGARVIVDGGALVLPVFHEFVPVSLKTHKLVVRRTQAEALITHDSLRADVTVEFYVRVKKDTESIQSAAQTLGNRTNDPDALKELVEGKFVDALRAVASGMTLQELHLKRADFVQKVRDSVGEDLNKNGLELETASLVGLDQTDQKHFNPDNSFDAEGLKRIKEITEAKRRERFEIEATTNVAIAERDRDQTKSKLEVELATERARVEQQRDLAEQRATTQAQIAAKEALAKQESELAQISADRIAREARIEANRSVTEREIENEKTLAIRRQESEAAIADQSRAKSAAEEAASQALALAVTAEETVETARSVERAERSKRVALLQAAEAAEREAIGVTTGARAEREAAEARAAALATETKAKADAEILMAQASAAKYAADSEGQAKLNAARNTLEPRIVELELRLRLVEALPAVLAAMVKPLEHIDSIRVVDVTGLGGAHGGAGANGTAGLDAAGAASGFPEQVVNAALRHRVTSPLVDDLLREVGITDPGKLNGILAAVQPPLVPPAGPTTPA